MAGQLAQLKGVVQTILEGEPVVLYDLLHQGQAFTLFLDSEQGVTLEACARYARLINNNPEVRDLFPGGLYLEVSSPGIHRHLRDPWHFRKAVGHKIKLSLRTPRDDGRKNFGGTLTEAGEEEGTLTLEDGQTLQFRYDDIKNAKQNDDITIGALS